MPTANTLDGPSTLVGHGPSRSVQLALWVVIPLMIFGGAEWAAHRPWIAARWYPGLERSVEKSGIDVVFIGSSRVAAAVDPEVFGAVAQEFGGRRVRCQSMARAGTTLVEHTLALRNLFERHGENLAGCQVMLELPGGMPPMSGTWRETLSGWDGPWAWDGHSPQLLLHVLGATDLPGFWRSRTSTETKIEMSLRFLVRASYLVRYRETLRDTTFSQARRIIRDTILSKWLGVNIEQDNQSLVDLADRGGIRRDAKTIALARVQAKEDSASALENQIPWRGWEHSALETLAAMLKAHGAELVLFTLPQSSVVQAPFETQMRSDDRRAFVQWASARGLHILHPNFSTTDEDFPDLSHLSKSKSGPFSGALAKAWMGRAADRD